MVCPSKKRMKNTGTDHLLTEVNDSILIIIDVQQKFLDKIDQEIPIVNRISWITEMAVRFKVPLIVTAEDIKNCGKTVSRVAKKFPRGTKEYNKMSFGLTGSFDIVTAIKKTNRKTAVLVGLETDVCVCQSAIGLLEKGYRVAVLADAVASPGPSHDFGIERMKNAGVIISSVKGLFYEWLRTVSRSSLEFKDIYMEKQMDGIYL